MSTLSANPACNPECRVCHYKKLEYPAQLRRKQDWAEQQLGRWPDALREIRPAPEGERLGYRSKSWMRSSFRDGAVSFGMFRSVQVQGEWEQEFVSWNTCPLHVPSMQKMLDRLRSVLAGASPGFLADSLVGVWIGSPHLVIVSRDSGLEEMKKLPWDQVLVAPFDRVWFHRNPQVGRKIFGHEPIHAVAGGAPIEGAHPIRAFRQVAQTLLVEARTRGLEALLSEKPELVVDLYCGTGDLSRLLPAEVGWIGIEYAKEAARYADTLKPPGRALHAAFVGGVEQRLNDPGVLGRISGSYALYVNPPRSGLTEEAGERVRALIRERPPTAVVYLSCSASSLARDLVAFEREGYRPELLQPYDFFPQTEHFETLAVLRLKLRAALTDAE